MEFFILLYIFFFEEIVSKFWEKLHLYRFFYFLASFHNNK